MERRGLRTSERTLYKRCRQAWWWTYVEGLAPQETSRALRFGDLVHQALGGGPLMDELDLEPWYRVGTERGTDPAEAFAAIYEHQIDSGQEDFDAVGAGDEATSAIDLGVDMLRNYVDTYGDEDHIEVVSPEMVVAVPFSTGKRGRQMYYCLTLDAVVRDLRTNQLGFFEHKTASAVSTRHLPLDEQAGSYWTFGPPALRRAGVLRKGEDLDFIEYNFLRKAMVDRRPKNEKGQYLNKPTKGRLLEALEEQGLGLRKSATIPEIEEALKANGIDPAMLGEPSKSQPPPLLVRHKVWRDSVDRRRLQARVVQEAREMDLVRKGKLPVYKNPSTAYPDRHCETCSFYDMCELHESGGDWEEYAELTMTKRDPYDVYADVIAKAEEEEQGE